MGFWDLVVADIHGIRPAELIEAQKRVRKYSEHFACMYRMRWSLRQTGS